MQGQYHHNYGGNHESWNYQQQAQQQLPPPPPPPPQAQGSYGRPTSSSAVAHIQQPTGQRVSDDEKVYGWIIELMHGMSREQALLELSKKREQYDDLALILWHSFGVMASLLQEIICVYPLLSPPNLTAHASNRVCNALALLQCVASHPETRGLFLNGKLSRTRSGDSLVLFSQGTSANM